MTVSAPLSKDDPLMIAWEAHKKTEEYDNSKGWAQVVTMGNSRDSPNAVSAEHPHLEGALWGMFVAGWNARGAQSEEGKL